MQMHYSSWSLLIVMHYILRVESIYQESTKTEIIGPKWLTNDALFGYSVAYQPLTKRLTVSAPNNDMVGHVFECHIENQTCDEIENNLRENYTYSGMWLGATVASGDNFTMACAPRYIEKRKKAGTFGKCFVKTPSTRNMTLMETLLDSDKAPFFRVYEDFMDTLGWSVNIDKHGSILVGGPAMYKGRAILYKSYDEKPELLRLQGDIKFNYGYSVTSGYYVSRIDEDIMYAISSTFGVDGLGMVIVKRGNISWPLPHPSGRWSPRVGAMFGATLATANLRSLKQRQALLVGAPAYTAAGIGMADVGAVYIYEFDLEKWNITHQKTILGKADAGRFGSAILSVGDLNGDERDEIAVSAPYEGYGVVYIYSGVVLLSDVADAELHWLQRIEGQGRHPTFGLSLATLNDFHGSGCNELVIGDPENSKVIIMRCIPKIIVNVKRLQDHTTKKYPSAKRNDTYFAYLMCLDIEYPKKPEKIKIDIQVKLTLTHASARLIHKSPIPTDLVVTTFSIDKVPSNNPNTCSEVGIVLPNDASYNPAIQYDIEVRQLHGSPSEIDLNGNQVMISDVTPTTLTGEVWVAYCSGDRECFPKLDFYISTTIRDNYTIGSSSSETIRVTARNSGDIAYSACAKFSVSGAQLQSWPTKCARADDGSLSCTPRRPIANNSVWESDPIELDMNGLNSDTKQILITVTLLPNCEKVKNGETKTLKVKVYPDYNGMFLSGSTNLDETVKLTREELDTTGKNINHVYSVVNNGITDWVNLRCDITLDKKPFIKTSHITVDSSFQCLNTTPTVDGRYTTACIIAQLKRNKKFDVLIPIYVVPGKLDLKHLKSRNETTSSTLKLTFGIHMLQKSVTSTLKLNEAKVPLWIIIIAALVGLLIIVILVFVLYECGFLRRRNKDKLRKLRRSVYRQSVHRQTMLRQSVRSSGQKSADKEVLIDKANKGDRNDKDNRKGSGVEVTEISDEGYDEFANKEQPNRRDSICKIEKSDEIIRGLQKNIGFKSSNPFLASFPKGAPRTPEPNDK